MARSIPRRMAMTIEIGAALLVLASLLAYTLTGGPDFGGGIWDLFARGLRADDQRKVISRELAPIWEANHVWLIVLIVLLWVCFPPVYSSVSTALHVPLVIMLLGIILRGTAFVFRSYGGGSQREQRNWGLIFSITSIFTPLMLGIVLGATATGRLQVDAATGVVETDFMSEWLAPFPFATGLFTLALFAFLAAVYLTVDSRDRELQNAFRRRALVSGGALAVLAVITMLLAADGAPPLFTGLFKAWWSIPLHLVTAGSGVVALVFIIRRAFNAARITAIVHVSLIVFDWAVSIYPWLIPESLSIENAAAPANVLWTTVVVMAIGTSILAPSLIYLYRVFKGGLFGSREKSENE
jgi:cytochrome bd ubiquinol oxidase subunit II